MFGTLRYDQSTNASSLLLEATDAPFNKQRQCALTRSACAQCRVRKSKCTGEAGGCQRCLAKNIQCRYPAPQSSKLGKRGAEGYPETSPSLLMSDTGSRHIVAENTEVSSTSLSNVGATTGVSQGPDTISEASDMIDTTAWSQRHNSNTDSEYVFNFDTQFVAEGVLDSFASDMPSLDVLDSDSSPGFQPESRSKVAEGSQTAAQDAKASLLFDSVPTCNCFSRAVRIHESIEIKLVSALQDQVGTAEEFLQQLKTCLAGCEGLLLCVSCRYRSEYTMLILSMCEKLASSLENAWLVMPSGGRAVTSDYTTRQDVSSPVGLVQPRAPRPRSEEESIEYGAELRLAGAEGRSSERRQTGQGCGLENRSAHRRLEIGLWKLDDEDEIHVFYGLLVVRVGMFRALLATLETLVTSHNWPVHKSITIDLQKRCMDMP
ncbi:uncharacterized protein F4807DRAFT_465545 [Annulohypoxylon truncatum]|uniref:uncharacterized protein n=1 Tax=Annulohypoxylon truncatum TaxID=327061 RepID=UPI002007B7B3|nr:uncharacterized protein F4807DRAFT_465545 [Annulohypoxylon truncatum]KAI1204519.1 hypothetical protein F4807DRAFT_465545 [Annulohypoxylon truncatum]